MREPPGRSALPDHREPPARLDLPVLQARRAISDLPVPRDPQGRKDRLGLRVRRGPLDRAARQAADRRPGRPAPPGRLALQGR